MTLAPLIAASPIVQLHTLAAVGAFLLGTAQLFLPKGTLRHRICGYIWAAGMVSVALSSFWIHGIRQFGPFSLIHLLSVLALISLPSAIYLARKGDIAGHRRVMLSLFIFALVGAGIFTLMPGRLMYQAVFGP